MDQPYRAGNDVYVLPSGLDVPGVGNLPVNSFVLLSEQPVLVDCGLAMDGPEYVECLRTVIDPSDLKWIWLTHDDADHTGNLQTIMDLAPNAQLATHGLGALRMATVWPVPLDRVHAVGPGDQLDVGDRTLLALRPPTYDNPMSTAIFDETTSTLFAVDSFGAILPRLSQDIDDFAEEELVGGMVAWTTFDSPWTHLADRTLFAETLDEVRKLEPARVLSSHLPPATGRIDHLLKVVASVPEAEPFTAPNAAAFREIAAAIGMHNNPDPSA
jgi:Metallo-beta-lactamase superfamily